ncbi:hypothetical protein BJY00DRAFT_275402 [Aspergillus carlsbadensis]|nr:hypothetical protein BJY00DRAFT_275402 [Aspergillus carlsbadensis]
MTSNISIWAQDCIKSPLLSMHPYPQVFWESIRPGRVTPASRMLGFVRRSRIKP